VNRNRQVHQHLSCLLQRPLTARALRGLPRSGKHHRRLERDCDIATGAPAGCLRQVYATAGYAMSVENLAQVSLQTDNVFGDDGAVHQLATVSGDVEGGFAVSLAVGVDTATTPSGGRAPGGAPSSGGPGGPGG